MGDVSYNDCDCVPGHRCDCWDYRAAPATGLPAAEGLREVLRRRHAEVCACPFDGSDPGCNLLMDGAELAALAAADPGLRTAAQDYVDNFPGLGGDYEPDDPLFLAWLARFDKLRAALAAADRAIGLPFPSEGGPVQSGVVTDDVPPALARRQAWPSLDDFRRMSPADVNAFFESQGMTWRVAAPAPAPGLPAAEGLREALEEMRAYARHAPLCSYSPTYPDAPVATCDCGFDAVLDAYEAAADRAERGLPLAGNDRRPDVAPGDDLRTAHAESTRLPLSLTASGEASVPAIVAERGLPLALDETTLAFALDHHANTGPDHCYPGCARAIVEEYAARLAAALAADPQSPTGEGDG